MMLRLSLGLEREAQAVEFAVRRVVDDGSRDARHRGTRRANMLDQ